MNTRHSHFPLEIFCHTNKSVSNKMGEGERGGGEEGEGEEEGEGRGGRGGKEGEDGWEFPQISLSSIGLSSIESDVTVYIKLIG